jgi:hypothetical protein
MFLGGYVDVDRIVNKEQAQGLLKRPVWDADDFALPKGESDFRADLQVPMRVVRRLRFLPGSTALVLSAGRVDQQTLRGLRELVPESAQLLEDLLDDGSSSRAVAISTFFRDVLGAPLQNTRWSWGAENQEGVLFLRVWADERETVRGVDRIHILGRDWSRSSAGLPERERQVERLRQGAEAYGVLCVVEDRHVPGPRKIAHFDQQQLLKLGALIDDDGNVYASVVGTVSVESVAAEHRRTGIPEGITRDDVEKAIQRLAAGVSHPFGKSREWDVVYGGKRFPPKAVLGLAAERVAGRQLGPHDFQSGGESKCNRILGELGFPPVHKDDRTAEQEAEEEAAEQDIVQRTDIGPTTKAQLVNARRGQGVYRANLEQFEKRCRVTGITDGRYLRASHIKPWCKSDDKEKLDGCNGLLLAPHVDLLFDRGWISFSDDGKLLVSANLNRKVLAAWGLPTDLNVGLFRAEQCKYLAWHRDAFGFAASGRRRAAP